MNYFAILRQPQFPATSFVLVIFYRNAYLFAFSLCFGFFTFLFLFLWAPLWLTLRHCFRRRAALRLSQRSSNILQTSKPLQTSQAKGTAVSTVQAHHCQRHPRVYLVRFLSHQYAPTTFDSPISDDPAGERCCRSILFPA